MYVEDSKRVRNKKLSMPLVAGVVFQECIVRGWMGSCTTSYTLILPVNERIDLATPKKTGKFK